jgi:hypothetical protein
MKKHILLLSMALLSLKALSQENTVTVSGGYSFANIEDSDIKGTGWRINGLYEVNPLAGKFAHGISVGYINLSNSETVLQQTVKNTVGSLPVFYAPKVMFGNGKIKAFIKGALGFQFAWLKREANVEVKSSDFGFYGGAGAGIMIFIKENIFINGEYEIAWASNSWYKDGWINTAGGGIGFKF